MADASSLLSFVIALLGFAFVITVHELGHFVLAKWAGVKVLRFSIGFPPIVWERQVGETSYTIGLLWLGGYVKMLGEADGEDGREDPRSFAMARPGWKALILLGGVTFNLISSWILLLCLAWYGMPVTPPVIGDLPEVLTDATKEGSTVISPAVRLGMQVGDEIRSINGVRTRSWEDVFMRVATLGGTPLNIEVRRAGQDLDLSGDGTVTPIRMPGRPSPVLGVEVARTTRVEGVADPFGLLVDVAPRTGWKVEEVDGQDVSGWIGQRVEALLEPRVGQEVTFVFSDLEGVRVQQTLLFGGDRSPLDLALGCPVRVTDLPQAGSPAAEAGLAAGDVITEADGHAVLGTEYLTALIQRQARQTLPVTLTVWRGDARREVTLSARPAADGSLRLGLPIAPVVHGWLPAVPPAIIGSDGGLAASGITAGDALVGFDQQGASREAGTIPVWVLSGGRPVLVDLGLPHAAGKILAGAEACTLTGRGDHGALLCETVAGVQQTVAIVDLPEGAREKLGSLEAGDWILRVGRLGTTGIGLEVVRGATLRQVPVRPTPGLVAFNLGTDKRPYELEYPGEAFSIATQTSYRMVADTLNIIPKFFRPSASDGIDATQSLSGPIGIFSMMQESFRRWGFAAWLHLVALIGLNLFLVNLLPIPIVDGGQLVILGIETVLRRPLPDRAKGFINGLGLALVVSLMLFVLSLDILRALGLM